MADFDGQRGGAIYAVGERGDKNDRAQREREREKAEKPKPPRPASFDAARVSRRV